MSPEMTEIASKDFCQHRLNVEISLGHGNYWCENGTQSQVLS